MGGLGGGGVFLKEAIPQVGKDGQKRLIATLSTFTKRGRNEKRSRLGGRGKEARDA